MDDPVDTGNLRALVKAVKDASNTSRATEAGPLQIREAVQRAASALLECYGAAAVERARLLENSAEDTFFAKLVTNEVERRRATD